jgi:hypothetical protein
MVQAVVVEYNLLTYTLQAGCTFVTRWSGWWSHDSAVCILTRPRAERSSIRIPTGTIYFSFLQNLQTGSGYHPSSSDYRGVMRSGRDFYHSPPYNAEVKNEWSFTFVPSVCIHDVDSVNCTFTVAFKVVGTCIFFLYGSTALYGPGPPRFVEASRSHTYETHHSR